MAASRLTADLLFRAPVETVTVVTVAWSFCGALGLLLATLGCERVGTAHTNEPAKPAPELEGGLTWLNSTPLHLAELRGRLVLLDFFEYSCVNCLRTLPYLKEWEQRYHDKGLVIIGVHTPQYGFSMDPLNVFAATKRLGLTYPIVVDSNSAIADAYQNRFWPRLFLIDRDGHICLDHTGEGGYAEVELKIQQLLRAHNPTQPLPRVMDALHDVDRPGAVCYPITAELYLGQLRGVIGNPATTTNHPASYRLPAQLATDQLYVQGEWDNASEYLRHTRDTPEPEDCLVLRYRAVELNVVMKPEDIYWSQVFVQQDGHWLPRDIAGADILYDATGHSYLKVDAARMYAVVAGQPYGAHELRLLVRGKGLSVYSFSFGTCLIPAGVDRLRARKESS